MRHLKTLKALLLSALITATAAGGLASTASAASAPAQVYFTNDSDASGFLNVYVDGQLVAANISAGSNMLFPSSVTPGEHQVVVTRGGQVPGAADLLSAKVNIPASGTYTLTLDNGTDALTGFQSGYAIDVAGGSPDGQ